MQDDTSSLYSLPESLRESLYVTKGERRFQDVKSEYPWPCDSAAAQLELLTAQICGRAIFANGLWWEPEESDMEEAFVSSATAGGPPVRILDLGSGMTATWCVSMAERFPSAEVIGVDLIPSDLLYLPPNVTIEIHDLLEGLPFPDDFFGLIHCRDGGMGSFINTPHPDLIDEIARALKPGGLVILEFLRDVQHPFLSHTPNNPLLDLVRGRHQLRIDSAELMSQEGQGRNAKSGELEERVRQHEAFRESVQTHSFEMPLGAKVGQGPPETQLGSISRDAVLSLWELMDAAAGLSEAVIKELKVVDRMVLPPYDVGLYLNGDVIWARKAQIDP